MEQGNSELLVELGHPGHQLVLGHPEFHTRVAGYTWNRIFSGSTYQHFLALGGPGIALERILQEGGVQS